MDAGYRRIAESATTSWHFRDLCELRIPILEDIVDAYTNVHLIAIEMVGGSRFTTHSLFREGPVRQ